MKKFNWFQFTMDYHWAYNIDWWWRNGWISSVRAFIHNTINDPYENERKTLPRYSWKDRDAVMESVIFKLFEEYCDSEDKNWNRKYTVEEMYGQSISKDASFYDDMAQETLIHNDGVDKMVEIYNFIKSREQKWEDAYDSPDMKLEDEMGQLDTKYLIEIVKMRGSLWT